MHKIMKKLIFLSCLIVLLTAASGILNGTPPAAELSVTKTGEETKAPAVAPVGAHRETTPPQALAADAAPHVPPQEPSEPAALDEPVTEQPPETAPTQPTAQTESTKPSTEPPQMAASPSSTPQSGDKRTMNGQNEIWIPGFGWIHDHGGGSIGTIATSDGDINKMVGYMGGDDPPRREQKISPEPHIPTIGDVHVDLQTGIQEVLTEDGWVEQNLDSK